MFISITQLSVSKDKCMFDCNYIPVYLNRDVNFKKMVQKEIENFL